MSREEKIYKWAQTVMQVEFVHLINKTFQGVILYDEKSTKAMIQAVNELLGEVTQIGDLSGTGLGIPGYGFPSGTKYEQREEE
jgi:hypothetical protein